MTRSTVFKNNKTQAVRLPKAVALPDDVKHVEILKLGNARLITPADNVWDSFFETYPPSDEFPAEREQPAAPGRRDDF